MQHTVEIVTEIAAIPMLQDLGMEYRHGVMAHRGQIIVPVNRADAPTLLKLIKEDAKLEARYSS